MIKSARKASVGVACKHIGNQISDVSCHKLPLMEASQDAFGAFIVIRRRTMLSISMEFSIAAPKMCVQQGIQCNMNRHVRIDRLLKAHVAPIALQAHA